MIHMIGVGLKAEEWTLLDCNMVTRLYNRMDETTLGLYLPLC